MNLKKRVISLLTAAAITLSGILGTESFAAVDRGSAYAENSVLLTENFSEEDLH